MSYQVMAWARGIKTGSITVKAVLMAVANYADENGVSWPSQEQLAEDVEASRHTVLRALDVLAERGMLKRERRHRQDGSRSSDRIILNLSYVAESNVADSNVAGNNVATDPEPMLHAATAEPVREYPSNPPSPPAGGVPDKVSSDDVRKAFDAYNVVAQSLGLPKARDLTAERRRRIRSRLVASGGLETWREALGKIRTSDFLTGRTERGFLADIDFLCQAKSFQRLIEGFYSERGRGPPADGSNVTGFDKAQLEERLYGKTG